MPANYNKICSICGAPYRICNSCLRSKSFRSWRTIADTAEHYKIFMALHGYTLSGDREAARQELQRCDLSDLKNFKPEIKAAIREIQSDSPL